MAKVWTLEEVRQLAKDGAIEVAEGSRFSPLAWDYIHEKKLEVRETSRRSQMETGGARPSPISATPSRLGQRQALSPEQVNEVVEEVLKRLSERGIV
jgi:ribosomal protein L19E